jgi:acetoacetyl-CoA synthetase
MSPVRGADQSSQLSRFMRFCEQQTARHFSSDADFYEFSISSFRQFWQLWLTFSKLRFDGDSRVACVGDVCETATFFPDVALNYVENLLATHPPETIAVVSEDDKGNTVRLTRGALTDSTLRLGAALRTLGLRKDDRVAAIAYNDAAAIQGALGALSIGATLSSTSPDMGVASIVGRFGQTEPKVLFCHLTSRLEEEQQALRSKLSEVVSSLPSLTHVIALDEGDAPADLARPLLRLSDLLTHEPLSNFERFPFNHPLFILFSSGTTGKPKCMVHGAGGTLLEHTKEHQLHLDLRNDDVLMFQTSCAWMMWNWQLSALGSGVTIVAHPWPVREASTLWALAERYHVTALGLSPAYLRLCEDVGFEPRKHHSLSHLRRVLSTGSVLHGSQFDWFGKQLPSTPLQSISGGTDIVGCFVLGHPHAPIYRGESQSKSLGLDVVAHPPSADGVGELVCRNPFPSRPVSFLNDPDGQLFHNAYFSQNEGVWSHGDLIQFHADGGSRLFGRMDGILNVNGIRMGPAEIENLLAPLEAIAESMAVEQPLPTDPTRTRLVLLLRMKQGFVLSGSLRREIRRVLLTQGSPAHVPRLIAQVEQFPATHSGKRSDKAVREALAGRPVQNRTALRNPEVLDVIQRSVASEDDRHRSKTVSETNHSTFNLDAVRSIWERILDVSPISPNDHFFELGGTSLQAVEVLTAIEPLAQRSIPPSALFEAPTLQQFFQYVTHIDVSLVVKIKPEGQGPLVVAIHGLAGDVLELRTVLSALNVQNPVWALRAKGLDGREKPHERVESMALDYCRALHEEGARTRPLLLLGYSFGGLVAYELARQWQSQGGVVRGVMMIDSDLHESCLPPERALMFRVLRRFHRTGFRISQRLPALKPAVRPALKVIEARMGATQSHPVVQPWESDDLTQAMRDVERAAWNAFLAFRPQPCESPVVYFRARSRAPDFIDATALLRQSAARGFRVVSLEGDHFSILRPPLATETSQTIVREIESMSLAERPAATPTVSSTALS